MRGISGVEIPQIPCPSPSSRGTHLVEQNNFNFR